MEKYSWQNFIPTFGNCREIPGRVSLFSSFRLGCSHVAFRPAKAKFTKKKTKNNVSLRLLFLYSNILEGTFWIDLSNYPGG